MFVKLVGGPAHRREVEFSGQCYIATVKGSLLELPKYWKRAMYLWQEKDGEITGVFLGYSYGELAAGPVA